VNVGCCQGRSGGGEKERAGEGERRGRPLILKKSRTPLEKGTLGAAALVDVENFPSLVGKSVGLRGLKLH